MNARQWFYGPTGFGSTRGSYSGNLINGLQEMVEQRHNEQTCCLCWQRLGQHSHIDQHCPRPESTGPLYHEINKFTPAVLIAGTEERK